MSYKRAEEVLPQTLIAEIQRYANGVCIYIPALTKQDWGSNTQTRQLLSRRNDEIIARFRAGVGTAQLAREFCLSVKSIQRIVRPARHTDG